MKPKSPRRQRLETATLDARLALIELTDGRCEWCQRPGCHEHHIANGQNRGLSLGKLFSVVWLCESCHRDLHELPKRHAVCIALALLRNSRPCDYNLEAFYKLIARRFPSEADVERWWERMLSARTIT